MRDQPRESLAALKAAVAVMGLLIVLGTALVVGVIIHRVYARNTAAASMPAVSPPVVVGALPAGGRSAGPFGLAPGEHIAGMASAGADLAVWVSGPSGERVLLIDPASGQVSIALQGAR